MTINIDTGILPFLGKQYNDPTFTSSGITKADWVIYLNDAIRAIGNVRPDALAKTQLFDLALNNTRQTLDGEAEGYRLLRCIRNMGAAGVTPGNGIMGPISMEEMDRQEPAWHTTSATGVVEQFIYNAEDSPKQFWIYPQVTSAWQLELAVAVLPTPIADETEDWPIGGQYIPAAQEWALYVAFNSDSERNPTYVKAQQHFQAFFTLLGIKLQSEQQLNPRTIETL